ncbi:GNAT family N-acetyltransferase [Actinospica sp.]|uniref:GNAT family N-acetyltransferase n=1 Tax=Actinospica sp. TaxID=1872142 RepID=UPI002B8369D9|nr:GNAT family N-acetyltransferase [Actinospica sp.]HWG28772.1 GNAT family N-acetyltransferase [Actinospica sp.]
MNTKPFASRPSGRTLLVTRIADGIWHALEDDLVVGRGHAARRPDGRLFVSIDAWHDAAFEQLAEAMLAALPAPLYTLVDEADVDMASGWQRVGFTVRRREWEFAVPTDPLTTGLAGVVPPPGVTIVPVGAADEGPLRAVDRAIRREVAAGAGWHSMPAEILPRRAGDTIVDPSRYAAAASADRYLGLVRLVAVTRLPRIGLIAVRAGEQRRGIARALLADVLGTLDQRGIATASAEVDEANEAALALFEGIGSRKTSSNLELAR